MSNSGKIGERKFSQLMQRKGYAVQDVTQDPEYFYKDIDFICTSPFTGVTKNIEVKWDYKIHKTKNLYLETYNRNSKAVKCKGWYKFCQADYLAYGDAVSGIFYMIDFQKLKERVAELPQIKRRCGEDSEGLIVSLEEIKDLVKEL